MSELEAPRQVDLRTPDGRTLRVLDDGAPGDDRVPLLLHHGSPMSATMLDVQRSDARDRGLRLVSYDRPGYGGSSRRPGRGVADVVDDVRVVADQLGLDRFLTAGASGGGPHALACAALMPERVAAAATVAGVAPFRAEGLDWAAGMGDDNVEEFGLAASGPHALEPFLEQAREAVLGSDAETLAEQMASLLPPADLEALAAGLGDWLHESMTRGLAPGYDGWLDDDLAFVRDWGFALGDVRVPVLVVGGGQDLMVPVAHARWLGAHVPGAGSDVQDDAGHLSLLATPGPLHEWLLARW
ncbi:alpha/beta hydrolase [Angustibacter peucedani]